MALSGEVHTDAEVLQLFDAQAITTAATTTSDSEVRLAGMKYLVVEAKFVHGSSGTTAKVFIQTSLDGGVTWIDVMCFAFTTSSLSKVSATNAYIALAAGVTPGDGALADNTIVNGLLGDRVRAKLVTTGTYADSTNVTVTGFAKG
jgi:hypothetical protein